MSINPRTMAANQGTPKTAPANNKSDFYEYPILKPVQGYFQLWSVKEFKDEKYGKERYGFMKLRYTFVKVVPGAEKAQDEASRTKFLNQGHGKFFSIEVNPGVSPAGINAYTKESTSPSGHYELLRILLNDGEPLTDAQLGVVSDDELKTWMAQHNAQAPADEQIATLRDAKALYPAYLLVETVSKLEAAHGFYMATPVVKNRADGSKYNKLLRIDALVPDEVAATLVAYKPYPKPEDPELAGLRAAHDDPELVCQHCFEHVTGYKRRDNGEYVSNTKSAEFNQAKYGQVLCGTCAWKAREGTLSEV